MRWSDGPSCETGLGSINGSTLLKRPVRVKNRVAGQGFFASAHRDGHQGRLQNGEPVSESFSWVVEMEGANSFVGALHRDRTSAHKPVFDTIEFNRQSDGPKRVLASWAYRHSRGVQSY